VRKQAVQLAAQRASRLHVQRLVADLLGRAADELAALQRCSEHLKRFGVHPIGELTHEHS